MPPCWRRALAFLFFVLPRVGGVGPGSVLPDGHAAGGPSLLAVAIASFGLAAGSALVGIGLRRWNTAAAVPARRFARGLTSPPTTGADRMHTVTDTTSRTEERTHVPRNRPIGCRDACSPGGTRVAGWTASSAGSLPAAPIVAGRACGAPTTCRRSSESGSRRLGRSRPPGRSSRPTRASAALIEQAPEPSSASRCGCAISCTAPMCRATSAP